MEGLTRMGGARLAPHDAASGTPTSPGAAAAASPKTVAPSPYEAPELYDFLFESLDFDLPFWIEVGRNARGPVLDVGCGTGRILLRLLHAGVDADGVDLYPAMLQRLHAKAAATGLSPAVVAADMRDFTMPRRYARAICTFNAFAHNDGIDDQLRALRCIRDHLEPDGALVMHMSYPGMNYWLEPEGKAVLELETKHPTSGHTLQLLDTRTKDTVRQCQRSHMEIREIDAAGRVTATHRFATTQRWVYRHELELLFQLAGYARWEIFGGFADEPLERDDQQIIAWAWRS